MARDDEPRTPQLPLTERERAGGGPLATRHEDAGVDVAISLRLASTETIHPPPIRTFRQMVLPTLCVLTSDF